MAKKAKAKAKLSSKKVVKAAAKKAVKKVVKKVAKKVARKPAKRKAKPAAPDHKSALALLVDYMNETGKTLSEEMMRQLTQVRDDLTKRFGGK